MSGWNAIFAPKGLPPDIEARLSDDLHKALDDHATADRLLEVGCFLPKKADRTLQALENEVARSSSVLKMGSDQEVIKFHPCTNEAIKSVSSVHTICCKCSGSFVLRFLGRPLDDAIHAHQQEASEKRQGTKSRRWSTELAAGSRAGE